MINKKNLGNLSKRMNASATGSNNGGSNFSVMDWKKSGNDELKFFKPHDDKNTIDIIPYDIKSKNHPMVRSGESQIGDADYMLEVWQHSNIGPSKKTILCLNRMYGKACPICEAASALRKAGKETQAKKLYAKQRAFYNVVDSKDPDVVKVFDVSYKLFEKELIAEAKDDENGFVDFADPTSNGCSVKFRAEDKNGGDFTFKEFKSFKFVPREEDIPDKILEQAISFDELLKVPSYDEAYAAFTGEDSDSNDEDEERPVKSSRSNDDDDEDETPRKRHVEEDDEDERPVKKHHVEEDDDDDEDERPTKKSKSFDDMDEVEEKKPCKGNCQDCPCGHKFGKDNDEFEDCDDCKSWQKCADAQKEME